MNKTFAIIAASMITCLAMINPSLAVTSKIQPSYTVTVPDNLTFVSLDPLTFNMRRAFNFKKTAQHIALYTNMVYPHSVDNGQRIRTICLKAAPTIHGTGKCSNHVCFYKDGNASRPQQNFYLDMSYQPCGTIAQKTELALIKDGQPTSAIPLPGYEKQKNHGYSIKYPDQLCSYNTLLYDGKVVGQLQNGHLSVKYEGDYPSDGIYVASVMLTATVDSSNSPIAPNCLH